MAFYYYRELPNGGALAILRVAEPVQFFLDNYSFNPALLKRVNTLKSVSRQLEVLATNTLLQQLLPSGTSIEYNSYGAPHLVGSKFNIAISHSAPFVALLIHPKATVGVDIESLHRNFSVVERRALSQYERECIDTSLKELHLAIYWGAKETLFKSFKMRNAQFSTDIQIEKFIPKRGGTIWGRVDGTEGITRVELQYEVVEEHILVWSLY